MITSRSGKKKIVGGRNAYAAGGGADGGGEGRTPGVSHHPRSGPCRLVDVHPLVAGWVGHAGVLGGITGSVCRLLV